jgi:hypothetical protein
VLEQVLHGFVEFLVCSIRNFEAVLAGGLECSGVLTAQVAFDTVFDALLAATNLLLFSTLSDSRTVAVALSPRTFVAPSERP